MRAVDIDFAPRSLGREVLSMRPLSGLFTMVALALCVGAGFAWNGLTRQQNASQSEAELLQKQIAAHATKVVRTQKFAISEAQANAVNNTIQQLNLPWSGLLAAVERATPSRVALLELEPDAKRHLVKGVAETKSAGMMIDYIRRLKQQPFFGKVVLTRHEASNEGQNTSLRFEFEAEWLQARQ